MNVVRRNDHLVAVLQPRCTQSEAEGIKPTGHTDAVRRSTVVGEGVLETRHVWPIRERSRLEESFDVDQQPPLQAGMTGRQIEKRHPDVGHVLYGHLREP